MPIEKESRIATKIRERLYREAAGDKTGVRMGTLDRLFIACDEVLSGAALQRALIAPVGIDPKSFRSRKLNPTTVEKYVAMRFAFDEAERRDALKIGKNLPPSQWKGPKRGTVQSDKGMMDYISERIKSSAPPDANEPERNVHRIIDAVGNPADQSALRQAMEQLHLARHAHIETELKLNAVLEGFRQIAGFHWSQVSKNGKIDPNGPLGGGLSAGDRELLGLLVKRLMDNGFLAKFGLLYKKGRVKMDESQWSDGSDLVFPEEMSLLKSLARIEIG